MQPNVLTFSAAAEEKECSRTTLYRAVGDGRLDTAKVGQMDMIARNEKYEGFTPKNRGARAQRRNARQDQQEA